MELNIPIRNFFKSKACGFAATAVNPRKMGMSELRRGVGLYRLLRGRTYCGGRISEKTNPSPSPLLMLPPLHEDESGKVAFKFHSLGNGKQPITIKSTLPFKLDDMYFAGSSHGWLFLHNWRNRDFCMLNLITGRLIELPPVRAQGLVSRVALSASPDDDEDECRAMVIFGRERRLAFCVPGKSTEWTPLGVEMKRKCEDVAYSSLHKLFYCVTTRYLKGLDSHLTEVESWDVGEPTCPVIGWRLRDDHHLLFDYNNYPWPALSDFDARLKNECWRAKYLVVHGDDLYLVVRHVNPAMRDLEDDDKLCPPPLYISRYRGWDASRPYKTFDFDVYKVDWGSGGVRYMKCALEGLAMIVGSNHSHSFAAAENSEMKADCIYFSDDNSLMRRSRSFVDNIFGGHDNGIYDYRNNAFLACCNDCVLNPVSYYDIKRIDPPPTWFVTPTLNHI